MSIKEHYPLEHEQRYLKMKNYNTPYFAPGELNKIENYEMAMNDAYWNWDIHHRLELNPDGTLNKTRETLIIENLYYYRPADELIFLTKHDHMQLHANVLHERKPHIASEITKKKQSEAKLFANNTEERYKVVSQKVANGETLGMTDYQFYRRYCNRMGIPFTGAKVDKSRTITRVDVPLRKSIKQIQKEQEAVTGGKTDQRYKDITERIKNGESISKSDYSFLIRYNNRRELDMPINTRIDLSITC